VDSVRRIGVVTVTYDSADVLPEFLESVAHQTFQDFFLYVVDNASKDNSIETISAFDDPRARVIANAKNLGVAEGNNQGIRAALADGCDAVLLLNNDTVFPAEMFSLLRDGLEQNDCAITTPKIYYHDQPNKIWAAGGYFQPWLGYRTQHHGEGQQDKGQFNKVRSVTYAPTCCVLIHRDVFRRIGLMDPLYFVYTDDVDFMYRALKAGFVMKYLPKAKLWHKVSSLTGGRTSDFTVRHCTRNRAYFLLKCLPRYMAEIWIQVYTSFYFSRFLLRKDSESVLNLKLRSVNEGRNMNRP
jgi:GT2 family glycosyltransferase